MATSLQQAAPFRGHSPEQERPLGSYGVLMGTFTATVCAFGAWMRATDRELPARLAPGDVALMTVATYKAARLITKSRVTSGVRAPFTRFQGDAGPGEVSEAARGSGMRRALGELLVCPHCISLWIATAFAAGLAVAPRPTRWVASVLAVAFGSDALQLANKKAEDAT